MKKILGLDLGCNSIGWALVNEAENTEEISSIIKLGVRVNPLTVDEMEKVLPRMLTELLKEVCVVICNVINCVVTLSLKC